MDPINPWLDAAEVRRLAERLLLPARPAAPAIRSVEIPPPLPIISAPISKPQVVEVQNVVLAEKIVQKEDSFSAILIRFRQWLADEFSAKGIFILDGEGSVIFDESGNTSLHAVAHDLALASRKSGEEPLNIRLPVGAHWSFEIILTEADAHSFSLAAIFPTVLAESDVQLIKDGLSQVARTAKD